MSINSYLRDLITVLHYRMDRGDTQLFKMKSIKVDQQAIETCSDEKVAILLKKPGIRKCRFGEYECRMMTNFLFSTGGVSALEQHSDQGCGLDESVCDFARDKEQKGVDHTPF